MLEECQSSATIYHIGKKGLIVLDNNETASLGSEYDPHWGREFSPWERLYQHHTSATASQITKLESRKQKPGDALDFCLSANYDHSTHLFPLERDVYLQNETYADDRRVDFIPPSEFHSSKSMRGNVSGMSVIPEFSPTEGGNVLLVIGGVTERRSPHAVRLNLSSHHMSRTAGGYGRKVDGTFYAP